MAKRTQSITIYPYIVFSPLMTVKNEGFNSVEIAGSCIDQIRRWCSGDIYFVYESQQSLYATAPACGRIKHIYCGGGLGYHAITCESPPQNNVKAQQTKEGHLIRPISSVPRFPLGPYNFLNKRDYPHIQKQIIHTGECI